MATEEKKEIIGGHLDEASSVAADETIARGIEQATDETEDTQATSSAEQVIPDIHPNVQEAGVEAVFDTSAQELHEAAKPIGGKLLGPEVYAGDVDGSKVTLASTKKALETQIIEARSMAAKGPADNELKWGKLARFIAGARKRFQHPQIETLPDNVTPIKSFGNTQQREQIAGPTLITSVEQKLPKAA